jgi:hypothetical protein
LRGIQGLDRWLGRFRRLSLEQRDRIRDRLSIAFAERPESARFEGTIVVDSLPPGRQRCHRDFERRYTPEHFLVERECGR